MEIIEGKIYIKGLEKSPCICSKAKYALGLKKVKPQNAKTCSAEYWAEVVTAIGKYNKVSKEKNRKSKKQQDLLEIIMLHTRKKSQLKETVPCILCGCP